MKRRPEYPARKKEPSGGPEGRPQPAGDFTDSDMHGLANKLAERVKELNCLYGISRLVERPSLTLQQILQGAVEIIPLSWQYPAVACARIKLDRRQFTSPNFKETEWRQSEAILVNGKSRGKVEVFYVEERPWCHEGPFLREERELVHAVAERLGHVIEGKQAQSKLQSLYRKQADLSRRLQAEMRAKADFTRNIIHELKTPLTSLLATSQLLCEETRDERLDKLARHVWDNACRLNDRIDELHDMARGETGKLELKPGPLDLAGLLLSVVDETQPLAIRRNVSLDLELEDLLPPVRADGVRVRQVTVNLLNNAFRYAADGGRVTLKARARGSSVKVEVRDWGPGIAADKREHLFDLYYRSTTTERSGGLGIGLALCKTLVELHGGKIWARSWPGKGTSFIFTLPRLESCPDGAGSKGVAL